jgi:hypothetical protein
MKYSLDINGRVYENFTEEYLRNSLAAMLDIEPGENNFLVLDPAEPVKNSIYIQIWHENGVFDIETRIAHDDDSYTHYLYKTSSLEEAVKIFTEYYLYQKLPDTEKWQDITDTM